MYIFVLYRCAIFFGNVKNPDPHCWHDFDFPDFMFPFVESDIAPAYTSDVDSWLAVIVLVAISDAVIVPAAICVAVIVPVAMFDAVIVPASIFDPVIVFAAISFAVIVPAARFDAVTDPAVIRFPFITVEFHTSEYVPDV